MKKSEWLIWNLALLLAIWGLIYASYYFIK